MINLKINSVPHIKELLHMNNQSSCLASICMSMLMLITIIMLMLIGIGSRLKSIEEKLDKNSPVITENQDR